MDAPSLSSTTEPGGEQSPNAAKNVEEVHEEYYGQQKGKGRSCYICGSRYHISTECPMNKGEGKGGKSKGKGKRYKGGYKGKGYKGGFKGGYQGGKGHGGYPGGKGHGGFGKGRYGYPKGKGNYATTMGTYQQWYSKAQGLDISDVIVTATSRNQTRPEEHHISTPRQDDLLQINRPERTGTVTETTNIQDKRLRFPVFKHYKTEVHVGEYFTVRGERRRGLIVDPGAASGLVGSETLTDIMETCIIPQVITGKLASPEDMLS